MNKYAHYGIVRIFSTMHLKLEIPSFNSNMLVIQVFFPLDFSLDIGTEMGT